MRRNSDDTDYIGQFIISEINRFENEFDFYDRELGAVLGGATPTELVNRPPSDWDDTIWTQFCSLYNIIGSLGATLSFLGRLIEKYSDKHGRRHASDFFYTINKLSDKYHERLLFFMYMRDDLLAVERTRRGTANLTYADYLRSKKVGA